MTTVDFTPSPVAPFQFQAVLDGDSYNALVKWNAFGRRYYVELYDHNGVRVTTIALISSGQGVPVSLVAGYFVSTLVFYGDLQQFVILP